MDSNGAILTSATVVGTVWAYRKLIEPGVSAAVKAPASGSSPVLKVLGAEPTPANAAQFAVGFGFTYMSLALIGTFAPALAGGLAVLIAVTDVIVNGAQVFQDVSAQVGEATTAPKVKR